MSDSKPESVAKRAVRAYSYVALWIALSAGGLVGASHSQKFTCRKDHPTFGVLLVTAPTVHTGVILYNKQILAFSGFPYPIALTLWHMFFCASLAIMLVRSGRVQSASIDRETYLK